MTAFAGKIFFIRHGETAFNLRGVLQGQRDILLNARGCEQARSVGRYLRDAYGAEMARLDAAESFWASPLARARETIELARTAMGFAPQSYRLDPRLMELSFGQWEGLGWREVERTDPAGYNARKANKWGFTPPGGESYATLTARVKVWLDERDGDSFVAAHGGVARALMALLTGMALDVADSADIWQGRALIFEKGTFAWVG